MNQGLDVSETAREVLKRYGLSEYESKAYATLVELGAASVREICRVAGIPQPRAYDTLSKLESKGLVETQDGRPTIYRAVPPKVAFDRLEKGLKAQTVIAVEEFASRYGGERSKADMWTIKGKASVINKIEEMINSVESQLLLAVPTEVLDKINPTLDGVARKAVEINLLVSQRGNPDAVIPPLNDAIKLRRKDDIPAILVVVDKKQALISSGCISNYKGPWLSVWTNEPSFIELISMSFVPH